MHGRDDQRRGILRIAYTSSVECFQDVPFGESVAVNIVHYALPVLTTEYGLLRRWIKINWKIPLIRRRPNFDPKALFAYRDLNAQNGGFCCLSGFIGLPSDDAQGKHSDDDSQPFGLFDGCVPLWRAIVGCSCLIGSFVWLLATADRSRIVCIGGFGALLFGGTGIWLLGKHQPCNGAKGKNSSIDAHSSAIVLTSAAHLAFATSIPDQSTANCPEGPVDAAGRARGPCRPRGYSLLVHLSCGLQSLGIGIWRGFCYAIEATENPEVLLTPCRGNIKMHRTGGPGLANASQVPVNTGQSEGHPSRKRADGEATHGIASMMLKRSSLSLAWHSVAWGGNALVKTRHLHRKVHTGTMVDAW